MPSPQRASVFVGRERELAELEAGLDEARTGRGGLYLLAGEPGIGKTRLAQEIALHAEGLGFSVAWGRCWEVGGAPAFWPWIQILRSLARAGGLLDRDGEGHPVGAALGRMLPELAATTSPASSDVAEERFRLFDSITSILRDAARATPLALIVDDMHSADPSSLAFLLFLARQLGDSAIYVLGTYRDQEARLVPDGGATLALIAREATYFPLARFGSGEVRTFLERQSGRSVSEDVIAAVVTTTEGHPLFVDEVVRTLIARPDEGRTTARIHVPETVRDAIRARLAKLEPPTRAVLERAAVLGRDVDARILAAMHAEGDPGALTTALRTALAAGVLVELEQDVYGFSHALVRDALYRELPAGDRRRLHARAVKCLEQSGAPDAARAEILAHLLAAGEAVTIDEVVSGAMRASARAMRAYAFEDAVAILDQTIPVLEARGASPRALAEALVLLGEARARSHLDASGPCRRAAEIAKVIDDPDLLARAALALGAEIAPAVVNATLVELLDTALRHLPAGKSVIRAKVMARKAGALQPAPDPREPMRLAREAIAMARETGDRTALRSVLIGAGSALVDFALPDERLGVDRETLRLADEDADAPSAFRAHIRLFMDHLELGKVGAADQCVAEVDRLSSQLRRPKYAWYACMMRAARALQQGRFDVADELEARARDIVAAAGDKELAGLGGLYACARAILRGEDARLRECFEGFADYGAAEAYGLVQMISAFTRARSRDTDGLAASFARIPIDSGFATVDPLGMYMLSEIRFIGRFTEGADVLLASLNARRGLFLTWGATGLIAIGPVNWLLARLESLLGSWTEAERDFDDAIAACTEIGAEPALAQVLLDYGIALQRRGDARQRSDALFDRAARLAAELALPEFAKRVESARAETAPVAKARTAEQSGDLPAAPPFSLGRDGDGWLVSRGERSFRIKDTRGMNMLAELVAEPGRAKHVLLLGGSDPGDLGDAGTALDAHAVRAYRNRLEDLRERERDAEEAADGARAARLRQEIDAITEQLAQGLGLGGRHRRVASAVERARSNVQRRLKDAIRRIGERDPELGRYLSWTVRTGTFCVFDPKIDATKAT